MALNRVSRTGFALIYAIVAMTALLAFVSIAVDFGRVQLAKSQLRHAVDAAARYAVTGLSDSSHLSKAQAVASANTCDGSPVLLQSGDVETGIWANGVFTPDSASPNAVRVTARRISGRGNAIPLLFAQIVGKASCNISAVAIATQKPGLPYAFVGLDGFDVKNNLVAASYDSSTTQTPESGNRKNGGMIGSNGSITAKNNEVVGSVVLGPGGTHNLDLDSPAVVLTEPIPEPTIDFSTAPASNPNGMPKNLTVNGTLLLPGGTYSFTSITLKNNAKLSFTGPANLYVDGNVTFENRGTITAYAGIPANLKIRQRGAGSEFGTSSANSVNVTADLDAPDSQFSAKNSAVLKGRAIFKSINAKNNLEVYYDEQLETYLEAPFSAGPICIVQ